MPGPFSPRVLRDTQPSLPFGEDRAFVEVFVGRRSATRLDMSPGSGWGVALAHRRGAQPAAWVDQSAGSRGGCYIQELVRRRTDTYTAPRRV